VSARKNATTLSIGGISKEKEDGMETTTGPVKKALASWEGMCKRGGWEKTRCHCAKATGGTKFQSDKKKKKGKERHEDLASLPKD